MDQTELFFPRPASQVLVEITRQDLPEADEPFRFEEIEAEPRVAYRVRLMDYPTADAAKVAEQRFRRELDRQLAVKLQ